MEFARHLWPPTRPLVSLSHVGDFINILIPRIWGAPSPLSLLLVLTERAPVSPRRVLFPGAITDPKQGVSTFIWSHEEMGRRSLPHPYTSLPASSRDVRYIYIFQSLTAIWFLWLLLILETGQITETLLWSFIHPLYPQRPMHSFLSCRFLASIK